MELKEFIIKNRINLADQAVHSCYIAMEIMRRSIAPLYDERHIFSIISNLDRLLNESKEIDKAKIRFDVLLLAICWHDVWRAKRFPLNLWSFLIDHTYEGVGSMGIFVQMAEAFGLDKQLIKDVRYTIRKHSGFQILPIMTIEGRILKDIDSLEEFSLARIKPLREDYLFLGIMNIRPIKFANFYFEHFMLNDVPKSFYFKWSKEEFAKRKKVFVEEAHKIVAEFGKFIKF